MCDDEETKSKRPKGGHDGHVDEMAAVEEIEEKKHKGVCTEEQMRYWVHLIQMKKHSSYGNTHHPTERTYYIQTKTIPALSRDCRGLL